MDLETENRLAALLMEEARHLRLQADKEGVGTYLHQPKVRGRPNARFLTATVLGVQQANRAVEVNEMWRAREKELELDNRLSHRVKGMPRHGGERHHADLSKESDSLKYRNAAPKASMSPSSSKRHKNFHFNEDDGLRDEDIEEFLQSRMKRGRGAVGSRMDEPGPYPVCTSSDHDEQLLNHEVRARDEGKRQIFGPEKPSWLLTRKHSKDTAIRMTTKEDHGSGSTERQHSKHKHTSEKSSSKRRKEKPGHHHRVG